MTTVTPPTTRRNVDDDRVDILIHQFYVAANLYLHEDELNWKKLHTLLYLNVGLGAVAGFVLENGAGVIGGLSPELLFLTLGVIGILVSAAFGTALFFGTLYLQNRKAALSRIEKSLAEYGGDAVVNLPPELQVLGGRYTRTSPTRWVLRIFPLLLGLIWASMMLIMLLSG